MKHLISTICIILCVIANLHSQESKDYSNKHLLDVATNGMSRMLNLIKQDNIYNYGFKSEQELESIVIGIPYRVCYLSDKFYESNLQDIDNVIRVKNEWLFPLIVDDTIRSLLTVGVIGDSLKVVGIGSSQLAKSLFEFENNNRDILSENKLFLREFNMNLDFVILYNNVDSIYIPTNSVKSFCYGNFDSRYYNTHDLLLKLKEVYNEFKQNIEYR